MKNPVVVIGIGEIGAVISRGLLRLGHPVYPVTRSTDAAAVARVLPAPALAVVAVGEDHLHGVLQSLPSAWRDRVGLLQNELLPRDWQTHSLKNPTVISVWFEKKRGQEPKVLLPSPVFGPAAPLLADALAQVDIPTRMLPDEQALTFELVRKNVYILTTNIAGLVSGGTVTELWDQHRALALEVAEEVIALQSALTGMVLDRQRLLDGMVEGFQGDPAHRCTGRSAPARLARALAHAEQLGLQVPCLRAIAAQSA